MPDAGASRRAVEKEFSPSSAMWEEAFYRRKRPVGRSWRMDETYIRVKGEWRYLYRAVDKTGQTIDFLLSSTLMKMRKLQSR